jgi:hypothetical protein
VPFEMLLMPCGDHQYPWGYDEYPSDISPSKYTKPAKFKKKKKKQTKIQKKQQQLQSKNEVIVSFKYCFSSTPVLDFMSSEKASMRYMQIGISG